MPYSDHQTSQINQISAELQELRSTTNRLQSNQDSTLGELREIGSRMIAVAEISAELREYRKTLHERFNRLHDQLSDVDKQHDDFVLRVDKQFDDFVLRVDKQFTENIARLDRIQATELAEHKEMNGRVMKVEEFILVVRSNWKIITAVVIGASSVVGYVLANYGSTFLHAITAAGGS